MKMRLFSTLVSILVLSTASSLADSYTISLHSPSVNYLVANQLDHVGGNSLPNLFPPGSLPDFTSIMKWNCSGFPNYISDSGSPSGWDDSSGTPLSPAAAAAIFLNPGEGFFINPSSSISNLTFTGTPHVPVLPTILPCGYGQTNYLSRQTNDVGTYENIIGLPPTQGAQEQVWNGAGFAIYTYTNGVWAPTNPPSLAVGQGAVFIVPTNIPPVILVYQGLTNTSLGNAALAVSGSELVISNLGSSGQDGVSIALPGNLTGLDVHWQSLDASNALPVGAYVQEQIIGTAGSITNGMLGAVTMTKAGTSNYVVSANFSPVGASTYTVQAYRNGVLVAQATNRPGASLAVCNIYGDSGCIPLPPILGGGSDWETNKTGGPLPLVTIGGGASVTCDRLYVTPDNVSGMPTAFQLTASQVPVITITSENESLVYQGLTNTSLGNATLAVSSNKLTVSILRTNGQDGVSIALNPGNNFAGSWLDLDPSNALPVGAYVQSQMIGTAGAVTNGVLGSTRCTKAGTSNYVITVDYTELGSSSRTLQVYNGTNLVAQVTGQTGATCATVKLPPGTCTINTELNSEWPKPTLITISGGSTVLGTGILMIPEGAAPVRSITAEQILAANIPTITLTNESVSVTYAGLLHTSLGNATLSVVSNRLTVGNLGSSGQDGVSVALPNNLTMWDGHWLDPEAAGALPVGAYLKHQAIGTGGTVTNGVLGTVQVIKAGTSNYVISADFSPIGASTRTVEVYNGPNLAARVTGQSGPVCATTTTFETTGDSGWQKEFPGFYVSVDFIITSTTTLTITGGPTVTGDRLVVIPEGGSSLSVPSAMQITASQIPSLIFTSEDKTLVYAGLANTSLGDAMLTVQSNQLTIGNLGTNGQDGVSIALNPGNNFAGTWLPLDPSNALPVGAYVQSQMIGTAGAVTNGVLGSTRCTKAGTSNYVITVDYTPLGSSSHTVQVYNGSVLVAQVTGQTGALCATVKLPPGTCTINPWLNDEWPSPTLITISGGPTVLGTEILMIPEGGATVSAITAEQILAANIPAITITNESVSVTYAGLTQTVLGNATLSLIANQLDRGSNTLDVANIGSSGQDGVSIALPGNLALDVGWQPLDPSNTLPVGAYVQEHIIGTAGSITNGELGTVTMTKAGTSNYVVSADFSPIGATHYTVQAYRNGVLVAQATNQNGASLAVCNIYGDSGCIPLPPILGGGSDWNTNQTGGPLPLVTIGGGASVTCDHLYVIPENVSGTPSALQITASQIPALTLTSVLVSPLTVNLTRTPTALTLQWFGTGIPQQSSDLMNWTAITNVVSPYVVPIGPLNRFYRISSLAIKDQGIK